MAAISTGAAPELALGYQDPTLPFLVLGLASPSQKDPEPYSSITWKPPTKVEDPARRNAHCKRVCVSPLLPAEFPNVGRLTFHQLQ